ncbi:MAG: hypothetical protein KDD89_03785 [Anaerolineales bacterium]|nr:hypothetical protein [Anaerolineales bacterium]
MATITLEIPDQLAARLTDVAAQLPDLLTYALGSAGIATPMPVVPPASQSPLLQEAVAFLAQGPTPSEIVAFKFSAAAQARLEELLAQAQAGTITAVEQSELNTYRQLNHLFILLKAQAQTP